MQDTSSSHDRHEAMELLLPWYATGQLDPEERATVEAHLRDCVRCRETLAADRCLADLPVASAPTPDAGWAAMERRLSGATGPFSSPAVPRRRDRDPRRRAPAGDAGSRRLRLVVAGQSAAIVLLVGWLAAAPAVRQPERASTYRALSSGSGARVGNVLAMFRPTVTERELRDVLVASGARVVDGPTSAGAYVLAVPGGVEGAGLARLRHDSAVTMAEPLDGDEATVIRATLLFAAIAGLEKPATVPAQVAPAAAASVAPAPDQANADAAVQPADEQPERRVLVMLRMAPEHYRPAADYGGGGYGDAATGLARHRLAERIAHDNHLVLIDNWAMPILGVDCVIMTVPGDEPLADVAARLSRNRGVAWSQPMNRFAMQGATRTASPAGIPNDRLFAAQPAALGWRLADLHRVATGRGVRVAVIDSMVDRSHPDLRGQLATVQDFVGARASVAERHGTGVAGIIAATENNGVGIAGVAPGARIMALRACWQRTAAATVCDSLSLARALVYAVENGAGVINMSLTGPRDELVTRLIAIGVCRGISVVAAVDPNTGTGFPALLPGVTAVASDGLAAARAGVYSAPGRDVPTTEPGGRWGLVNGNSFAAAHVSGLLALARQVSGRRATLVSARADGGSVDACSTVRRPGGATTCRAGR